LKAILPLILLVFIVFGNPDHGYAQVKTSYESRLEKGIESFYRSDWTQALSVFRELQLAEPQNPKAYFFDSMIPFWQYFFATSDSKSATEFLKRSEKAIDVAERRLKRSSKDTSAVLMLSGLYGYRSLVAAAEKEYTTAIKSGVTGFTYTRQLLAINDTNDDALIGKGVFQYMVGSIPKEGRWMTNMIGMSGTMEGGFRDLERASASKSSSRIDAMMILAYLYDREKMYPDALRVSKELVKHYPQNIIFQYYLARSLDMTNQIDKAVDVYRHVVQQNHDLEKLKDLSTQRLNALNR
jgi:tetratricopeptide (TPR) repeat protein